MVDTPGSIKPRSTTPSYRRWPAVVGGLNIAYGLTNILLLVVSYFAADNYPGGSTLGFAIGLFVSALFLIPTAILAIISGIFSIRRKGFILPLISAILNIILTVLLVSVYEGARVFKDYGGVIWVAIYVTPFILGILAVLIFVFTILSRRKFAS